MTRTTPTTIDNPTRQSAEAPYITESSAFAVWLSQQRQNALRLVEDLDHEIAGFETEIAARHVRRNDLLEIVRRVDVALGDAPIPAQAPDDPAA